MRILMVSSYPPMRCGIGRYTHQMVLWHRQRGDEVDVLSPAGGKGNFMANLQGPLGVLRILGYARRYDEVVLHYQDSFYYRNGRAWFSRLFTHLAFILLFILARNIRVVVHELRFPCDKIPRSLLGAAYQWINQLLKRIKWRVAPRLDFHSHKELKDLETKLRLRLDSGTIRLLVHHFYMRKWQDADQATARRLLRLPRDGILFLCIGFIQPQKGFDRALRAFASQASCRLFLYVVGSLRVVYPEVVDHLKNLEELARAVPNSQIIKQYLSDAQFDLWLIAADVVVIPYREIWTSGVLARAKLFKKRVIAAEVGGLPEQIEAGDRMFQTDAQLAGIFQEYQEMVGPSPLAA